MSEGHPLDRLVAVNPRFARSVSITRDAGRKDALDGYILTPNGRDMIRRMALSLRGESTTRAWSLTGPYGSGKSSLALLIAQLLSGHDGVRQQARKALGEWDGELANLLFGAGSPLWKKSGRLFPVLVTGTRQPLDKAIARSLAESLRAFASRGRSRRSSNVSNAYRSRTNRPAGPWPPCSRRRSSIWSEPIPKASASC